MTINESAVYSHYLFLRGKIYGQTGMQKLLPGEQGKRSLNEAYARLQLWNMGLTELISCLDEANQESKSLLTFIQKEYNIK